MQELFGGRMDTKGWSWLRRLAWALRHKTTAAEGGWEAQGQGGLVQNKHPSGWNTRGKPGLHKDSDRVTSGH